MASDVPLMTPAAVALRDALMSAPLFERIGEPPALDGQGSVIALASARDLL